MTDSSDIRVSTLNFNVGVLGHVDSGKTSLARALSSTASTAAFDKNPQSGEGHHTGPGVLLLHGGPPGSPAGQLWRPPVGQSAVHAGRLPWTRLAHSQHHWR
ncbi:hypothetical protein NHX12_030471 [Muraenolepis orangiensis]|uniref:Tr-type G domain-containing protein n=1 Tax=Muraenolepis orangiensis TaxID=630683 RepID=A0A9Q0E7T1_9TELE|nr:hypothetical protein NHX12_030471 [Muraenolepis orangiensis]